jgi:hypothetical protein
MRMQGGQEGGRNKGTTKEGGREERTADKCGRKRKEQGNAGGCKNEKDKKYKDRIGKMIGGKDKRMCDVSVR